MKDVTRMVTPTIMRASDESISGLFAEGKR
jgi:hypothetical protein